MDNASSPVDTWGCIPGDVLFRLLDILSEEQTWKQVATEFASVNKHWREAMLECVTVLRPQPPPPFKVPEDVKALSKFPNLHSLWFKFSLNSIKGTVDTLMMNLYKTKEEDVFGGKPVVLKALRNLKLEETNSLVEALSIFCHSHSLRHLFIKKGHLKRLPKGMKQLTQLRTMCFQDVDMVSAAGCLDLLTTMEELEALELSFKKGTHLGSVTQLTRLQKLTYLKINAADFDFTKAHVLSRLQHLSTLVLDGTIYGDDIDLSRLSQVVHLSISSLLMPCWIPLMQSLQSLNLTTSDDFKYGRRKKAMLSIARRLKSLQLKAVKASQEFVDQVFLVSTNLEKLTLTEHIMTAASQKGLHKVKEVVCQSRNRWYLDTCILSIPAEFPNLVSLTLDTDCKLSKHNMELWKRQKLITQNLRKLVLFEVDKETVEFLIPHLHRLREFRLLGRRISIRPFQGMLPSDLPELKKLCLNLSHEVGFINGFFEGELLIRLDHLALPKDFTIAYSEEIRAFKRKAPHVLVDDIFDEEHDAFKIQDPFQSQTFESLPKPSPLFHEIASIAPPFISNPPLFFHFPRRYEGCPHGFGNFIRVIDQVEVHFEPEEDTAPKIIHDRRSLDFHKRGFHRLSKNKLEGKRMHRRLE